MIFCFVSILDWPCRGSLVWAVCLELGLVSPERPGSGSIAIPFCCASPRLAQTETKHVAEVAEPDGINYLLSLLGVAAAPNFKQLAERLVQLWVEKSPCDIE